ncbi:sugar transferase [Mesorhizobium sp.]|uniref:sugar transferase n=1 Tax=Mesorhizobium sp. TaxID=1871066 RepID=UPI000FE87549|nr:sugar transferase [Mesorhizobium sp.]RWP38393.1 MAG: sugar transferase [Mesorhizobium sp.]
MYHLGGKRFLDIVVALFLMPLACVLSVFCMIAIRSEGPGPTIFRQVRVGREQRQFVLFKLRTMSLATGDRASHEVAHSKITRVGMVLRKSKLDELPQLINVLRGDMSLVGPRPCLPSQHLLISEREKHGVFSARPGITGPAQLAGVDMSRPVELAEIDAGYVRNLAFWSDLRCILLTAVGHGRGDAVNRI